jgi:hypothetical protein
MWPQVIQMINGLSLWGFLLSNSTKIEDLPHLPRRDLAEFKPRRRMRAIQSWSRSNLVRNL